jgi:predicted deacylase
MVPEIETIQLQTLASGDRLYLQVYKFSGQNLGKKVYIQANLHGAEIAGNAVIYQLIDFLSNLDKSQVNGEIWLVPVCNPLGVNQKTHFFSTGRFNPYDGKDWNRIFGDFATQISEDELELFAQANLHLTPPQIRANYLQKIQTLLAKKIKQGKGQRGLSYSMHYRYLLQSLSIDANYLIDLHSASIDSIDYLYCFPNYQESASYLLFDYAILLNEYKGDTFDEAFIQPWLLLENKLRKLGKNITFPVESWTLELGSGMTINPNSVIKTLEGIKNYLHYKNFLSLPQFPIPKEVKFIPKDRIKSYYALQGGMIQNCLQKGTKVKQGDKLYEILSFNKSQKLPTIIEVISEDSGLVFDVSSNQTVNQGEYVLGIFPNSEGEKKR